MYQGRFSIQGDKVQNIGYRALIIKNLPAFKLEGTTWNSPGGFSVDIELYGDKEDIKKFRQFILENPPREARIGHISPLIFKKTKIPYHKIGSNTGYFMVEQLGKGIDYQKKLLTSVGRLPKRIAGEFNKIVKVSGYRAKHKRKTRAYKRRKPRRRK